MPVGMKQEDVCAAIDMLTAKSQSCQGPANQINTINIALAVSGFGPIPVVIQRLSDIVTTGGTIISLLQGTNPYSVKSDEDAVVKSLTTFVEVHQALLNILIGKSGLVPNLLPYVGPPLAQVLRQLESIVDTIAYELIDLVPDNAKDATTQKDSLDVTLSKAIDAWNGGITISA
ncbi:hypothetical protein LPUS_08163 [Lasallia pustulata]|uniref:Uncharacterized protein n=1 Tax=Lasallia pustulata TaxID=136370 RepID=A0A1W5D4Q6_9LECA|nr:hypothetical protein LPUS_08163 [Lasallia pustulata]